MFVCGLLAYFNQYPPIELVHEYYKEQKDMFFQKKGVTDLDNDRFYEYTFDSNGDLVKMRLSGCRTTDVDIYWWQTPGKGDEIKKVNCDLSYVVKDEDGKYHSMKRELKFFKQKDFGDYDWGLWFV